MPENVKRGENATFETIKAIAGEARLDEREAAEEHADGQLVAVGFSVQEPENDLGNRLQDARRRAGLTQGELSKRTKLADATGKGIARPVISLYESGVNRPSPRELRIICEALRVSPSMLIYGTEDPFDSLTESGRFGGWGRNDAEFLAYLTYAFTKLHEHPRMGIMQVMLSLLRGWSKDFDRLAHKEAFEVFLQKADELRLSIATRKKR